MDFYGLVYLKKYQEPGLQ